MERVRLDPPMRDIVTDLKDRLREVVTQRDEYLDKAKELDRLVEALMLLIDAEHKRSQPDENRPRPDEALPEFIFKTIRTRPINKTDLHRAALTAGYRVDGRSIHATTVNLVRSGRVVENDGVFSASQ